MNAGNERTPTSLYALPTALGWVFNAARKGSDKECFFCFEIPKNTWSWVQQQPQKANKCKYTGPRSTGWVIHMSVFALVCIGKRKYNFNRFFIGWHLDTLFCTWSVMCFSSEILKKIKILFFYLCATRAVFGWWSLWFGEVGANNVFGEIWNRSGTKYNRCEVEFAYFSFKWSPLPGQVSTTKTFGCQVSVREDFEPFDNQEDDNHDNFLVMARLYT